MKRIGIATALLASAIALVALSVTSVAAARNPEYLSCGKVKKDKTTKKYTGHYTDKNCAETNLMNEGKYERVAVKKFPIKTSAKKFGETKIYLYNPPEHKNEAEVACEESNESGTINNNREQTITIAYSGCAVPVTGKFPGPCTSPGKSPGKSSRNRS